MVPLDGIGGEYFFVIVLEGSDILPFSFEDELSMVILEAPVWFVVEPLFVVNC